MKQKEEKVVLDQVDKIKFGSINAMLRNVFDGVEHLLQSM